MRKPLHASRRFGCPRPGPSPEWQPPLVRQRRVCSRPILIAAGLGLAFASSGLLLDTILHPMVRLLWNASASAPIGLYFVAPIASPRAGDIVVVRLTDPVARLAAARHYLPIGVPLVKRVGAMPGDRICAIGAAIIINGRPAATRFSRDRSGRSMPWWQGCTTLRDGRIFLLSPVADAFDSRYFGPVEPSAIIGRAQPLWTAPTEGADHD